MKYGMFSPAGDAMIHGVVITVKTLGKKVEWRKVQNILYEVAENYSLYGEATDTAVREAVYVALEDYLYDGENE